jgi:protein farnesyltransferase subunit beta
MSAATAQPAIPALFTTSPPIEDSLITETSLKQSSTVAECLPFLTGEHESLSSIALNAHGIPPLDRPRHIAFLHKTLQGLPPGYAAADASRPWMFYWALAGLSALGEADAVAGYRERLVSTVRPLQHPEGGFGGGNGQMAHLAPTYAVILALAMVGGHEALEVVDRKKLWKWLGRLKQKDGGFRMAEGGEEDVR